MKAVQVSDIRTLAEYEREREEFRRHILAVKEPRRVTVGNHLTFLFENVDTVVYQIQEMLRVERITDPTAIAHEVETYNELVPGRDELTATLLIEFEDPAERAVMLRALVGLERRTERMKAVLALIAARRLPVTIPAVVVAEWYRGQRDWRQRITVTLAASMVD